MTITKSNWILLILALVATNLSCQSPNRLTDQPEVYTDPIARIHALEIDNARMKDELQNKSEQLAVLNANVPGGLALGEREKQLEQKESRLKELETRLQEQEGALLQVESKLKEDRGKLQVDQKQFHSEKEERLVQIGEAKQMVARYESVVKERNDAVAGERLANQRVEEFVLGVTVSFCVALAAVLIAAILLVRLRMQRQHTDSAIRTGQNGDTQLAMKEQIVHVVVTSLPCTPKSD